MFLSGSSCQVTGFFVCVYHVFSCKQFERTFGSFRLDQEDDSVRCQTSVSPGDEVCRAPVFNSMLTKFPERDFEIYFLEAMFLTDVYTGRIVTLL